MARRMHQITSTPASHRIGECFVNEQSVATARPLGRMQQNKLTDTYLAAFEASGITASEFHAAVQPVTVGTNMDGRCLTRPGFLEREQVQQLEADLETLYRCLTG